MMKKVFSPLSRSIPAILLVAAMLFGMIPAFSAFAAAKTGDLNKDGLLDIGDVTALLNYLKGDEDALAEGAVADITDDGVIDIADVTALLDLLAGRDEDPLTLSEEAMQLYRNSYDILFNRITDRGYAITSLTGTYVGMFTRDSSIQAMAHLAYGDKEAAKAILKYLLSYHAALDLERAAHILDELQDEEYGNNYLTEKGSAAKTYDEQTTSGREQFLITAPDHAAAAPFLSAKKSADQVQVYLGAGAGAQIIVEIYTDLANPATLIGKGSYTLENSTVGWVSIPLERPLSFSADTLCYLKVSASSQSGRVVWYGIDNSQTSDFSAYNYDPAAYGGNGWRQVGVLPAFIIGESNTLTSDSYMIAQRKTPSNIYIINAPNNGAAQPFIPKGTTIRGAEVHLNKTKDTDTVELSIRTDYRDPATTLAKTTYTFGKNQNGWQTILLDDPIEVTPGKTYYLVLQATSNSGKVIWNGTTDACGSLNSYNYDQNALGGWAEKPYFPAFEILSYPTSVTAQGFEARGNTLTMVDLTIFSASPGGSVTAEIRRDYTDPTSVVGKVSLPISGVGEQNYTLTFEDPLALQYGAYYYLVISLTDTDKATRLLTDPSSAADSHACGSAWERIGFRLLASARFEVDSVPLISIEEGSAAYQEIPTDGETITAVRVLLSKEKNATGTLKATLYKGVGAGAQQIDVQTLDIALLTEEAGWITFCFDLPFFKPDAKSSYFLKLEAENAEGSVFWCGSSTIDNYRTFTEKNGVQSTVAGEAGFEALRSTVKLISNYTQTDANYMLLHAWALFASSEDLTDEDMEFVKQSYPIVKKFANYYLDKSNYYNKNMNLLFNPSLEHSRLIRYWQSYDLLTNVFASQALYELSPIAKELGDSEMAEKWSDYAAKIEKGIKENLVTEVDGKQIYGEFYDVEDNMKFYQGISWINLAPVAAEWYATDRQIMQNTYDIYKKYASITMYGYTALATEATLGTTQITRELIGKGLAWELMFCRSIGDTERIYQLVDLVLKTAERNNISVYPEFWKSETYVTDPGNQEHCSWQVYAMSLVFSEALKQAGEEPESALFKPRLCFFDHTPPKIRAKK